MTLENPITDEQNIGNHATSSGRFVGGLRKIKNIKKRKTNKRKTNKRKTRKTNKRKTRK